MIQIFGHYIRIFISGQYGIRTQVVHTICQHWEQGTHHLVPCFFYRKVAESHCHSAEYVAFSYKFLHPLLSLSLLLQS